MKITKNDTVEFDTLYQAQFGIRLTKEQARSKLELLVAQIEIVYRPITLDQLNEERISNGLAAVDYEVANSV